MAVTSLPGAPTTRLSFGRLAAINAFWFGGGAHWQPIYIALIPVGASIIAAYLLVQLSNNAAGAAYTGVIPDVVRAEDRGRASGLLGTMNQLGTVVGVGLVGLTFKFYGDTRAGLLAGYGVVAVIMAITLLITVL